MYLSKLAAAGATLAVVSGLASTLGAWGVADSRNPRAVAADDGALARDIASLAAGLHLSEDEVARQLELQSQLDKVELADNMGFAGVANHLGKEFVVEYYSTTGLSASEWSEFDEAGLSEYVREVHVNYDLAFVRTAIQRLRATAGLPRADIRADIADSALDVVSEAPVDATTRSRAGTTAGMPVRWSVDDHLLEPALGGGRVMSNGCTGGFVVVKTTTGNRGLSSAAHCSNSASYDSKALTHMNEWQSGRFDLAWWDNDTITWENKIKDGVGDGRVINAVMPDSSIDIGDPICKYGDTTGYDCGEVTDVIICPNWVTNCASTFIEYDSTDSPKHDMAQGGDSGGPVFFGNTAWGIIIGQEIGGTHGVFMQADYFTDKELAVATN
ncbi:MAG: putative serine protease [Nocardioides sp.]|nr:putative serine protease [Nocardioides sp.]